MIKQRKKITPFFIDERGEMSFIINNDIKVSSILLITSKKGAVRANHYHKKDGHYSYMLSGRMEYSWYDASSKNKKKKKMLVREGDLIYTPPMIAHAMRFLENSSFLTLDAKPRDKDKYEEDLIRVRVI